MLNPVLTDTPHVSSRFYTQLKQNALVDMLEQYQDRTLFHLVLTYKPFHDRSYAESDVNKFFIKFYLRYFLPYLMNTSNYHRDSMRPFQPICLVFVRACLNWHRLQRIAVAGLWFADNGFLPRPTHLGCLRRWPN